MKVSETLHRILAAVETARDTVQKLDTSNLPSRGIGGTSADYVTDTLLDLAEYLIELTLDAEQDEGSAL